MNILKKIINISLILIAIFAFNSCDKVGDIDPGKTSVGQFAGDWFINVIDSDNHTVAEHVLHSTYNTSANDNTLWIDDHKNGYTLKCKVVINEDGTFSATNVENVLDSGTKVTITNGRIEKGTGVSKGGHKVDKISFRAHFSYDAPGYDILYTGHKRTGFYEDEY